MTPDPATIVIFGATGDLTSRKLMPSLYRLWRRGSLPAELKIVGAGRKPKSRDEFREDMRRAVEEHDGPPQDWERFAAMLDFVEAGGGCAAEPLSEILTGNRLFYLAIPPSGYEDTVRWLDTHGFARAERGWSRIVVEKPFGRDRASAERLTRTLHDTFAEDEVFRIDHYLGKETVQNLFVFRFANGIFEPVWNRRYVDSVQITVAESLGVEQRGAYYEEAGAVRDMVQNHLLQLLCLSAMEPPVEFGADAIRDEKAKVLHAVEHGGIDRVVRGQYKGYRDEPGVSQGSNRETYVALECFVDNWRWAGVPWLLRTGKKLPERLTEIAVHFKEAPFLPFTRTAVHNLRPNVLAIRIQPNEGIELCLGMKAPHEMRVRNTTMKFDYDEAFGTGPPEAYERLLLDALLGDATLFTRDDEITMQWNIVQPLLDRPGQPFDYQPGTWGPPEAQSLIAPRAWRFS